MDTVFKVVFRGEIAPGQDVDQVKRNIAALYKVQVAQCEKMFKGKRVCRERQCRCAHGREI